MSLSIDCEGAWDPPGPWATPEAAEAAKCTSNAFLRFKGTTPNDKDNGYGGATIAFLGGNGAGSCYDATPYLGVTFKVKGTVSGTPADGTAADALTVSFVTAQTQSTALGGNAPAAGGHFHAGLTGVSGTAWKTCTVLFKDVVGPSWGWSGSRLSTSDFPVGITQMQAVDFGVAPNVTVDLSIDDVKLTSDAAATTGCK
jgi:hypothetical protein